MHLEHSQNRIRDLMTVFVTQIKGASAMGRTDIKKLAEIVLRPLFRVVYGLDNLHNLNETEGDNFPGVDLGDERKRVAIQVTSQSDSEKIKDTLRKFVKHSLYERYDRVVVYVLEEKQKSYSGKGFEEITQGKLSFDPGSDIHDYRDILALIAHFDLDRCKSIEGLLEQNFGIGVTSVGRGEHSAGRPESSHVPSASPLSDLFRPVTVRHHEEFDVALAYPPDSRNSQCVLIISVSIRNNGAGALEGCTLELSREHIREARVAWRGTSGFGDYARLSQALPGQDTAFAPLLRLVYEVGGTLAQFLDVTFASPSESLFRASGRWVWEGELEVACGGKLVQFVLVKVDVKADAIDIRVGSDVRSFPTSINTDALKGIHADALIHPAVRQEILAGLKSAARRRRSETRGALDTLLSSGYTLCDEWRLVLAEQTFDESREDEERSGCLNRLLRVGAWELNERLHNAWLNPARKSGERLWSQLVCFFADIRNERGFQLLLATLGVSGLNPAMPADRTAMILDTLRARLDASPLPSDVHLEAMERIARGFQGHPDGRVNRVAKQVLEKL